MTSIAWVILGVLFLVLAFVTSLGRALGDLFGGTMETVTKKMGPGAVYQHKKSYPWFQWIFFLCGIGSFTIAILQWAKIL